MTRAALALMIALALGAAVPASAHVEKAFPRVRLGAGALTTSGGGIVAGDAYSTRSAAIVWNRKWNTLTLYLLWRRGVTCGNVLRLIGQPGHLIQVHVTSVPRVHVARPMPDAQVAFLTIYRSTPEHVAGLKHGATLTFRSVDSYPGGVWSGTFTVPTRIYGDGKTYGYRGTFAAKFCELRA